MPRFDHSLWQVGTLDGDGTVYVRGTARSAADSLVPLFDTSTNTEVFFEGEYVDGRWQPVDSPHWIAVYDRWCSGRSHRVAQELLRQHEQLSKLRDQEHLLAREFRRIEGRCRAAESRVATVAQEAARIERNRRRVRRELAACAVFSRNHKEYLKQAARIGDDDPGRLITFRSRQAWVSAADAVKWIGARQIYFAMIGEGHRLTHRAWLQHVVLDPSPNDPETAWALSHSLRGPNGTFAEKLWRARAVRTLYLVSGCERFPARRSVTSLVKVSDGHRISADYRYSYSLVRELE